MNESQTAAWWQSGWERAWVEPGSLSRIGKSRRIWRGLEQALDRRMHARAAEALLQIRRNNLYEWTTPV